jgi:hypothetical protein
MPTKRKPEVVKVRKTPSPMPPAERERGRGSKEVAASVVPQSLGRATKDETAKHRQSILKSGKIQKCVKE